MYWPRLKLTPDEAKYSSKYWDPRTGRRGVLRRMYNGSLTLSTTQRQPEFSFQISRRTRVFGLTASGDVSEFQIRLQNSSGEQFTADPIDLTNLLTGSNENPLANTYPGFGLGTSARNGMPFYPAPFIIDPNIVLSPNETLKVTGSAFRTAAPVPDFRVDIVLHVWEFPGYPGSPL